MQRYRQLYIPLVVALLCALAFVFGMFVPTPPSVHADTATSTPGVVASSTPGDSGTEGGTSATGATIDTGDAASLVDVDSTTNLNDTTVSSGTTTPATSDSTSTQQSADTASSTEPQLGTSTPELSGATSSDPAASTSTTAASTTVTDTNVASTTNDAIASADTGGNTGGGGGNTSITTGDAIASANVINVVNLNLVNSTGLFAFLNFLMNGGGIDLGGLDLSYFFDDASSTECSLLFCGGSLTVRNANTATTTNDVSVTASTGGNSATSTDGATISTGNAYASANVVNVVNTNLVNSHYLLVALNNFGDLRGDITLPDARFFERLLSGSAGLGASSTVANNNAALLESTTSAQALTGGNTATGDGTSTIQTGNALSNATTYNQVNTNLTGGTTVFMLVNVFGNWSGSVQGLPAGLSWARTPEGVAIVGGAGSLAALTGDTGSSSPCCGGSLDVGNDNSAAVRNDVQVYALTGQNYASSTGAAAIATGNAYASANVVNLVNTNVVGQNWILAIMNIFGDWNGNLAFGAPDLWIGGVAKAANPTPPGSTVTYTFTVANHGQVAATGVSLLARYDTRLLSFQSGSAVNGGTRWDLGSIAAGASKDFTFTAQVGDPADGDTVAVPLTATLSEAQNDSDSADNTENVTITVGTALPPPVGGTYIGPYLEAPKLTIDKSQSVNSTTAPASVDYRVVVSNALNAGPAYNAVLSDDLRDPAGNSLYAKSWNLGTIAPGDQLILTYTVKYATSSTPGAYTDTSRVSGWKNYTRLPYANAMTPVSTSSTLEVLPSGQVLGASTSTASACGPFITSYLFAGGHNDPAEVTKLQGFLSSSDIPVAATGVYDAATVAGVKEFQLEHHVDVLDPWGITQPTGNVYYTTQREINVLACGGTNQFTLSRAQVSEIAKYRGGGAAAAVVRNTQAAAEPQVGTVVRPAAVAEPPVFSDRGDVFNWLALLLSR